MLRVVRSSSTARWFPGGGASVGDLVYCNIVLGRNKANAALAMRWEIRYILTRATVEVIEPSIFAAALGADMSQSAFVAKLFRVTHIFEALSELAGRQPTSCLISLKSARSGSRKVNGAASKILLH